ncbi:MAG TPA: pilus assembly protein PilM [Sedimentisphaerales bacterium]|nr:pilus assembly protein PilM [Sedimentisphaerales bacterium]
MFGFGRKQSCLIGVDLGNDCVKLAQLANGTEETHLIAGQCVNRPADVTAGTARWQRWAIDVMRESTASGQFKSKDVVAALPASEVFIDHLRWPKKFDGKIEDAIFAKIKQKLPFEPIEKNTLIKYIPAEQDNVIVLATERTVIDRHLAIYERAGLTIKSIGVWPVALANCYARFFGRRKTDLEAVVLLLDIQLDCTHLVICRHKNPLYAHYVPIGAKQLKDETAVGRLVMEMTACRREFLSLYKNIQLERLIFLSGLAVEADVYRTIAKQMEVQAQMGDCMAAVEIQDADRLGLERRNDAASWALAFGLSLSLN